MNTDIRLSVGFWRHPKTVKLQRRLGLEAVRSLQILWLWAAENRPSGDLSGMDEEDLAIAADWLGETEKLVGALSSIGFLDGESGSYSLHGWQENNAWASGEPTRADKGRFARLKGIEALKETALALEAAGVTRISKADYAALVDEGTRKVTLERLLGQSQGQSPEVPQGDLKDTSEDTLRQPLTPTPTPTPAPTPVPTPNVFKEHTHTESHDLYAPQQAQCACASPPPLNGEDIAERRDAAQAHHQRGDYEFNTLRSEYDRVKREAPFEGRAEFMRLFHSPEWGSSSLDEILAGLDRLASSDRGFVCEERFRPGLAKFLSTRMWTMEARSPDDEGIPTPEQAEQKRRYEEGRKAYEAKMAARRAARS